MLMKKVMLSVSAICAAAIIFFPVTIKAAGSTIDKSNLAKGYVTIKSDDAATKQIKVQISKGTEKYVYNIENSKPVNLPLQMGDGEYTVMIVEVMSTKDGKSSGKPIVTEQVKLDKVKESDIYTNSIQLIDFSDDMTSIKELNKLIETAKNDEEKINIIYDYIINNITYDMELAKSVPSTYLPVIDKVYAKKSGICYDYSSLFASILRDNGIPTKLQMGYAKDINEYHAWNEVFINNKWQKIDTTYDAQANTSKIKFTMVKDNNDFQVSKQY